MAKAYKRNTAWIVHEDIQKYPRGYSKMSKLKNDPIINNSSNALSSVSVIVSESSVSILTKLILTARDTDTF